MNRPLFARVLCVVAVSGAMSLTATVRAAVQFNFSGGGGTPLTVTIPVPLTYTVTSFTNIPIFVIDGAGNVFHNTFPSVAGTASYSVNAGPAHPIDSANSEFSNANITADDLYFLRAAGPTLSLGDTVTIPAGSFTTTVNVADPAPASGLYESFITNGSGSKTSINAVPEPASLGLIALGSLALVRRRR